MIIPVLIIIDNILSQRVVEDYYFPVGIIGASLIMVNAGFYMSLDHAAEALNEITEQIVSSIGNAT